MFQHVLLINVQCRTLFRQRSPTYLGWFSRINATGYKQSERRAPSLVSNPAMLHDISVKTQNPNFSAEFNQIIFKVFTRFRGIFVSWPFAWTAGKNFTNNTCFFFFIISISYFLWIFSSFGNRNNDGLKKSMRPFLLDVYTQHTDTDVCDGNLAFDGRNRNKLKRFECTHATGNAFSCRYRLERLDSNGVSFPIESRCSSNSPRGSHIHVHILSVELSNSLFTVLAVVNTLDCCGSKAQNNRKPNCKGWTQMVDGSDMKRGGQRTSI